MQNVISSDGLSGGLQILAVITLLVFESAYALGLGPVPLLTLSEVFPATIRGKCIGFCAVILWVTHILFYEYIGRMTSKYGLYNFLHQQKFKYSKNFVNFFSFFSIKRFLHSGRLPIKGKKNVLKKIVFILWC